VGAVLLTYNSPLISKSGLKVSTNFKFFKRFGRKLRFW